MGRTGPSDSGTHRWHLTGRAATAVGGCALATLCYALMIKAGLGLGPLFAVQDGLATLLGISIGTAVMVVGMCLIVLAAVLRSWPGPGTLGLPFLGGLLLNLMLPHLPSIHAWPARLLAVLAATWVMGLGGSLIIKAGLGATAYDAVMMGIHKRVGGRIAVIRLAMELSMLVVGWRLGGAIGIGTLITGVLIGPSMHCWLHVLGVTRISREVATAPLPTDGERRAVEVRAGS